MKSSTEPSLLVPDQFIQAIRDSGYKNLASALGEIVDNALEAEADKVKITIRSAIDDITVCVADNGRGMSRMTLRHALQFGWSSRFNSRTGFGRFGMGLPNASLSVARRVELYSRVRRGPAAMTALDVDGVCRGGTMEPTQSIPAAAFAEWNPFECGSAVVWRKCDRLSGTKLPTAVRRARHDIGRLFRYQLWAGKNITINGEAVRPIDPLFQRKGDNLTGAKLFGSALQYEVEIPRGDGRTASVRVRFTELPVNKWCEFSNVEKNAHRIAKNAGVSIVRAGREIDSGWYFMGGKRKENYDDWWRCEVSFDPDLDELFGVTHSKQEIRPAEVLTRILSPEIEAVARVLNARVRTEFTRIRSKSYGRASGQLAQQRDGLLEPPPCRHKGRATADERFRVGRSTCVGGVEYRIRIDASSDGSGSFFHLQFAGRRLTVVLNKRHSFVERALSNTATGNSESRRHLELLILAAARAELMLATATNPKVCLRKFRDTWSKILNAFYA